MTVAGSGWGSWLGVHWRCPGPVVWADVLWVGPGVPGQPGFPQGFVSAIGEAGAELARRYPGVLIWFGCETWQWWALPLRRGPGALVAASSAQELAQLRWRIRWILAVQFFAESHCQPIRQAPASSSVQAELVALGVGHHDEAGAHRGSGLVATYPRRSQRDEIRVTAG